MPDIRYTLRLLWKSPAFAVIAALTLALGIGANTAMFSVAEVMLYRPVDLPDLERLFQLFRTDARHPDGIDRISVAELEFYRRECKLLEHVSAAEWWNANITGTGDPERVQGYRVSRDFFAAMGVAAELGRTPAEGEDTAGKDDVVVLGHDLWLRRFGGDPKTVGTRIELNGRPYRVIGVMPKGYRVPRAVELWVPLAFSSEALVNANRWDTLMGFGRLRYGVTEKQAGQELKSIAMRIAERYPDSNKGRSTRLRLFRENVSGELSAHYVKMMMGASAFVLLIACVNVSTLLFARLSGREREMCIRTAMGAARWRLIRQMLTESGMLGLTAVVAGVLFATWGVDLMRAGMPPEVERYLPGWYKLGVNGSALAFATAAAVLSGVLAGIVPAWNASQVNLNEGLKESGRSATSSARRHLLASGLVVFEIVLALVLLVGAGLLTQGFRSLSQPYSRGVAKETLTMRVALPVSRYDGLAKIASFEDRVLENLRRLPGVKAAGLMAGLPYSDGGSSSAYLVEGEVTPNGEKLVAGRYAVSPQIFHTLGISLLQGREIAESDHADSPPVVVVNEAFVRRHFQGRDPIGRRIRQDERGPWMSIVGVVRDVRQNSIDRMAEPAFFPPYRQAVARTFDLAIRTDGDPMGLIAAARAQVLAVDRDQPVFDVRTIDKMVSDQLKGFAYVVYSMGISGALALILATVGVYSVMASAVSERTHEIGIRMALGANESQLLSMVLKRGMALAGIGLLIGTTCAWAVARALSSLIFGVSATDYGSYTAVIALLVLTVLAACLVPARRAMRIDPVIALRDE